MERKFGRYAISGLMKYICVLYLIGLFINISDPVTEFECDLFYFYFVSLLYAWTDTGTRLGGV